MADYNIGTLFYKITGDTSSLNTSLKKSEDGVTSLGKKTTSFGSLLKGAAFAGALVFAAKKLATFGKAAIDAASDAEESINAVTVVFGEASDEILDFSDQAVESVGLSSNAFKELATVTGAQLKNAGTSVDELGGQVIDLTTRAADVASVFNTEVDDALEAFNAALRGEAEPARRFAVNISDAAVQAEALASGLVNTKAEITDQIKVQARYNLILKQTTDFAGDFANTSESFSNQLKIAGSATDDLKAALGVRLLPVATETVSIFGGLVQNLADYVEEGNKLRELNAKFDEGTLTLSEQLELHKERAAALEKEIALEKERSAGNALAEKTIMIMAERAKAEADIIASLEGRMAHEKELADLENERAEKEAEQAELELEALEENEAEKARIIEEGEQYVTDLKEEEAERRKTALEQEIQSAMDWNEEAAEFNKSLAESEIATYQQKYNAFSSMTNGIMALTALGAQSSSQAAGFYKVVAATQAGINSYLAFTKTLTDGGPFPLNVINAGGILASGIAQQIKIQQSSVPAYATGGDFVTNGPQMIMVGDNPGGKERVQITPESSPNINGPKGSTVNVYLGTKKIATEIVDTLNTGQGGTINSRIIK